MSLHGIPPLPEAPPPLARDPLLEVRRQLLEHVLLVAGQRADVVAQLRLDMVEIRQAQRLVYPPQLADRVLLLLCVTQLYEPLARDQVALGEEGVEHLGVLPQRQAHE